MTQDLVGWGRWGLMVTRAVVVGAAAGLLGGALIFFFFGFIGFAGAPLGTRIENGWDAVLAAGLRKGLAAGLGIAIGLTGVIVIWAMLGRAVEVSRTRPWLAGLAALIVVLSNLDALRTPAGWDVAGLATVIGIALLVGVIVWAVAPWVLHQDRATRR